VGGGSVNEWAGRSFLGLPFWYFGQAIPSPAGLLKHKIGGSIMRAIIRIVLPETTDDQAIKIKAKIEAALKDSVVKREIEMTLLAR